MAVRNVFSKRKAARLGQLPSLQSESLPDKFRVQVARLFVGTIGGWFDGPTLGPPVLLGRPSNQAWATIFQTVAQEHGRLALGNPNATPFVQCMEYLGTAETDAALDLIEVALQFIDNELRRVDRHAYEHYAHVSPNPDAAIEEFNTRCRENGVGYSYASGEIISSSSSFVHTEVVEPALALLHEEGFRGAQDEFLKAHRHLRHGETKSAIVEANNAFESTMKTICTRKRWSFQPGDTASKLVAVLIQNGFVPTYLQNQLTALRTLLETGVPVVRNKGGGHGQGPEPVDVPRARAEYAIHLTAANIVFLVKLLKS